MCRSGAGRRGGSQQQAPSGLALRCHRCLPKSVGGCDSLCVARGLSVGCPAPLRRMRRQRPDREIPRGDSQLGASGRDAWTGRVGPLLRSFRPLPSDSDSLHNGRPCLWGRSRRLSPTPLCSQHRSCPSNPGLGPPFVLSTSALVADGRALSEYEPRAPSKYRRQSACYRCTRRLLRAFARACHQRQRSQKKQLDSYKLPFGNQDAAWRSLACACGWVRRVCHRWHVAERGGGFGQQPVGMGMAGRGFTQISRCSKVVLPILSDRPSRLACGRDDGE